MKKTMNTEGADLDVYKAMEQMKSAESVLEAKVAHYKGICKFTVFSSLINWVSDVFKTVKDQKTKRKAMEREEPVYV